MYFDLSLRLSRSLFLPNKPISLFLSLPLSFTKVPSTTPNPIYRRPSGPPFHSVAILCGVHVRWGTDTIERRNRTAPVSDLNFSNIYCHGNRRSFCGAPQRQSARIYDCADAFDARLQPKPVSHRD